MLNASSYPTFKSIPGVFTAGAETDKDKLIAGDFVQHDEDCVNSNAGWPRYRYRFKSGTISYIDGHASSAKLNKLTEGNVKTNY